ncbi:MAG: carbohydrate binding domain-containing protein [Balneolales bacterium]|nr:carbohydrate binding domain-containing protein [Balneolales bacterium]
MKKALLTSAILVLAFLPFMVIQPNVSQASGLSSETQFETGLTSALAQAGDNVIINGDFSDGLNNWTPFIADFAGVSASVNVVDGEAAITNIAGAGGEVWFVQLNQVLTPDQIASLQVGETYTATFDARSNVDGRPLRFYFGEDQGGFSPVNITDVVINQAVETYTVQFVMTATFGQMKFGFEMGTSNDDVYISNVSLQQGGSGEITPPPAPVGFVASDMIGPNPVGPGEVFLAAGPNNVSEGNIEYRLFYSETASQPGNPLNATEYQFGSIPGDGNGIGAFGFVITSLNENTDYTFWLYQYNVGAELFSEPGIASAVSGGEDDDPPPPIGDDLIFNGDFSDGLTNWTPFIADFAGVSANIEAVDGEAAITNISGAGGEIWYIQLNQVFTPAQIAALEVGETYTATFDVRSSVDGRPMRFFFGEEGGNFAAINSTDIVVNQTLETFEISFEIPQTFGQMKLGFEMGTSNDDVFISNVSFEKGGNGEVTPPPAPAGFVASDMIGTDPVGTGELFLAVGPNNVGDADIEYRLFYSETASQPGNPLDATEYQFGSTPGDGDGISAFGFVLTGLNESTDYTFWLYQYNTAAELFSEPGVASAVSGGEGDDPPPPVGDNIIFNGDFSDGLNNWTPFIADFAGVSATIEAVDGEAAITNISGAGAEIWYIQLNQVFTPAQIEALEIGELYTATFDVRSSVDGRPMRFFFGEEGGNFAEINSTDLVVNQESETFEITFELTQTFGMMKLGFEMGTSNDDVFISNVSFEKGGEAGDTPPPAPAGFVVSDMIGENPVGDGELFLAAGPNNVEEENIRYRLFYSVTASQPDNPLDATEYAFGSTAGDGEGVGAFGFVISGLEEAVEYTFWLYQFDDVSELFSAPATGSAVSGGEGDEPPPVGENIIINGDFADGLNNWTPFVADFAGVSADFAVVDGEAAITNISGAGAEVWYVQFNQILTPAQIASLEVGASYTASFNARSTVDDRPLRLYFGEDGGGFVPVNNTDITIGQEVQTYDIEFVVTQTYGQMKFGFEMGTTNESVFISDVSFQKTGEGGGTPPAQPEGFVATDMVGETPVMPGEIFLAVGPNDVEEDNIVYRMFYSTTEGQPENPFDGTEHEFGSVPGDGEGNNAFGFVLGGLESGTEYIFWLYQFDTSTNLFSTPAIATAVSGGEAGPGPEIVLPVTFEENINWADVFVNFDGGMTTVIDNPDPSGINTSDRVAQMVKGEGQPWAGSYFTLSEALETAERAITIQVWAPRDNTTLLFKIENSENPDQFLELEQTIPVSGEWTELNFDVSSASADISYDRIVLIFDLGTVGDGSADFTWFFDNIDYGIPTNTGNEFADIPTEFALGQNYPNPFNPTTQIQFALPENSQVRLDVFNLMGQRVATLVNESMSAGTHTATFDGASLASGLYLYRLQAGTNVITKKMMLVK